MKRKKTSNAEGWWIGRSEGDDTRSPQALDKTIRRKTLNAQRSTSNAQFRKSFMLMLLLDAPSSCSPLLLN
jgi:hypothetical protein